MFCFDREQLIGMSSLLIYYEDKSFSINKNANLSPPGLGVEPVLQQMWTKRANAYSIQRMKIH